MKICLVGSILRHTVESDAGTYKGWGGMTESAVAPFAALLGKDSKIYFVGSVGRGDIAEVKEFFAKNYPIVDPGGIRINPAGTDEHRGNERSVKVKVRVEPTRYEHIEPYIHGVDAVIFNFGNIDDIDPEAIKKVKDNSKAIIYVDVHRKPFGVGDDGYMYSRGWSGWEDYLRYADVVQMNKNECEALFRKEVLNIGDVAACAREVLDVGVGHVIITLGSQGALVARRTPSYVLALTPAIPCNVLDTTGCGDSFAAGYLVSFHEGKSLFEAAKLGTVMAAVNCEFLGYMRNMTRQAVEKRMPESFNVLEIDPNLAAQSVRTA